MIPWWGWLIIGVVALVAIAYSLIGLLIWRMHQADMRKLETFHERGVGRSFGASSQHFTDQP